MLGDQKNVLTKKLNIYRNKYKKQRMPGTFETRKKQKIENHDSVIFLVGGAFGVPKPIINKCHSLLSFSEMTFPHLIARLILLEQTYRAFSILNNHPYHHE